MNTMLEQDDAITLAGTVAWRCHECSAQVSTRQMLHEREGRLLCVRCKDETENIGD
jgi:DNA-directed RNA polymerase subunit RPC12/RpoP